ncbi:conserved domain protein [Trichinella spiralis]|uniref:hypothetical protein n=1 Tax=Trichinella spiralis TaxID=6334 RepID=UPI0001EFB589|nr:conserved domain protein [Trichinella spiralis]
MIQATLTMVSTHWSFDSRTLDGRCGRGHQRRLGRRSRRLEVDHRWGGGGGCRGTGGDNRLIIMTTRFHANSATAPVGIVAFDNVWQSTVGREKCETGRRRSRSRSRRLTPTGLLAKEQRRTRRRRHASPQRDVEKPTTGANMSALDTRHTTHKSRQQTTARSPSNCENGEG